MTIRELVVAQRKNRNNYSAVTQILQIFGPIAAL